MLTHAEIKTYRDTIASNTVSDDEKDRLSVEIVKKYIAMALRLQKQGLAYDLYKSRYQYVPSDIKTRIFGLPEFEYDLESHGNDFGRWFIHEVALRNLPDNAIPDYRLLFAMFHPEYVEEFERLSVMI